MDKISLYKLDESTTTGIPIIDSQYAELFDRVNNLQDKIR